MKKLLGFWLWGGIFFCLAPVSVEATLSSCTASVSPNDPEANVSDIDFTFTLTNTDSVDILWFKIQRPFSEVTLGSSTLSGWYKGFGDDYRSFWYYKTPISPGGSLNPVITASIGDVEGSSGNWTVTASDSVDGSNPITCTGNLLLDVSGGTDVTAPTISNVTVSSIGSGTATIGWTTNEPATSVVDYTTVADEGIYPFQGSDGALKTSHSITITSGLAPSTTYYYVIQSADEVGNTTSTNENSFTTGEYVEPSAEVITQTVTVQATPSPVETKTIIVRDTTAPSVVITTDVGGVYEQAPTISGVAQDTKGVFRVDYSVDGGRNWLPVDDMSDAESARVSYSFTPLGLLDGNYKVKARAIDTSNNAGFSKEQEMIIDRLPPRVGTTLLTIGPQPLRPTLSGLVYGLRGMSQKVTLSSVGGATSVDLVTESESGTRSFVSSDLNVLGANQQMYSLSKNSETGLWSGSLVFNEPGLYKIIAQAVDGADNKTKRELQSVYVLPNGRVFSGEKVVAGAQVTAYVLNTDTNRYVVWDGESFGQKNPQETDPEGKYGLILPAGRYYLEVKLKGHRLLRTPIFDVSDHTPINTDFYLEELSTINVFGKEFYLPSFKRTIVPVSLSQAGIETGFEGVDLVGEELPFFILNQGSEPLYSSDLVGEPMILTFLTTWSPVASQQMEALDKAVANGGVKTVVIFEQETISKATLFMKRGGYDSLMWADEDGELVDEFSLHSAPTHIMVDSKGIVKDVVVGFLRSEKLLEKLY